MYIGDLWKKVLYGDQPAGWDIAGTKETVLKIERKDIKKYIDSQYVPKNTIVCVAGKINEEEVIKKVNKYFSQIKDNNSREKVKVIEEQKEPQIEIIYKDINQTNLALGVRGYSMSHPNKFTMDVMAVILGGMMSSRMFSEVREKLGAAYYVRTYNNTDPDTGSLVTLAGVENGKIHKVIETILKEYLKLTKKEVSIKELKKAKEYLKGKIVLRMESSDAQASFYGTQELLKNEIISLEEVFKRIDKVSANDIMNVAKDIFKNDKLNLALIGPFKNKKDFNLKI